MHIFEKHESIVRSYCRDYTEVFETSKDEFVFSGGNTYLDFLSGCGALNYGHNPNKIKKSLIKYIENNGVTHSMDCHTAAKKEFIKTFVNAILKPRNLDYRLQFPGPTGTNGIEAAIKLARKVTNRSSVISFTNGFHGCTLGALALTGSQYHRNASVASLHGTQRHYYDGYFGDAVDTCEMLEQSLKDPSSGFDAPAAIVVECVQGEGGINVASRKWLRRLQTIANAVGALLIVDDIQAGCGRTGSFFSFEKAGIKPDIVVLSKSLSGYGLPFSMVLLKPEHDQWNPGEHNGTFRGNNHAFVTATAALEQFWRDDKLERSVEVKELSARTFFISRMAEHGYELRGRGLLLGIETNNEELASSVKAACFENNLIVETCGPRDTVVKILPPLTISNENLIRGLSTICDHLIACKAGNGKSVVDKGIPDLIRGKDNRVGPIHVQQ